MIQNNSKEEKNSVCAVSQNGVDCPFGPRFVIVRGAGDLATGVIHMLHKAGFKVLALEIGRPTAIRRQVSFSEAVYDGSTTVEGVTCELVDVKPVNGEDCETADMRSRNQIAEIFDRGNVPLLIDENGEAIAKYQPPVLIDAIIAKKNIGTKKEMASLTIALGPGFEAGVDVGAVIETKRGHKLGRIIYEGTAIPNTGVPGLIEGYGKERVIHTPASGVINVVKTIGDEVKKGEVIAHLQTESGSIDIPATMDGFIRGMIRDGFEVCEHFKMADIDPRMKELENCYLISDKARCIAGAVLVLVCAEYMKNQL